jgi:predicted transcriptional regulator of viral defense system
MLRTSEALDQGVHPRTLYAMRDAGMLERLDRGLYRLTDLTPLSDPDLVTVASRIPKAVICLISALHFHDMTTQIPHAVSIAVSRGTEPPRLDYPPIQLYWFSGEAFTAGVETHRIDDMQIQVYSAEKTLADCFKYRNKIGMDTVLEALNLYRQLGKPSPRKLLEYARVCRVEKVMRPYLEALL